MLAVTDPAIALSDVLHGVEILSILCGGGVVFYRLGRFAQKIEQTLDQQNIILSGNKDEIVELKQETRKLGEVLTKIAVQDTRMNRLEEDLRELKHGHGFTIIPP